MSNKLIKEARSFRCYIEEYDGNNLRLREKVTKRRVTFACNNKREFMQEKNKLINFMYGLKMLDNVESNGYLSSENTDEYIYVCGHVIKETSELVDIKIDEATVWLTEIHDPNNKKSTF